MRYLIGKLKRLPEEKTRFFVCCIVIGLEYLHNAGVIHRDVKPENIVLDKDGYARLTDFGIAKLLEEDNSSDTSGTPGYMAPEVLCKMRHGMAVDYFGLGVITYEFMMGRRPYPGRTRKDIRDAMMARQAVIDPSEVPSDWNPAVADFINKLLQRKPTQRLGYNSDYEVMQHPWIRDVDWDALKNKTAPSPFSPIGTDNFDEKFANENWRDEDHIRGMHLNDSVKQELFIGYAYNSQEQVNTTEVTGDKQLSRV